MKFLLQKWDTNRFDLLRSPIGYPPSDEGNHVRAMLEVVKSDELKDELNEFVLRKQLLGELHADDRREAGDVAITPPWVFD